MDLHINRLSQAAIFSVQDSVSKIQQRFPAKAWSRGRLVSFKFWCVEKNLRFYPLLFKAQVVSQSPSTATSLGFYRLFFFWLEDVFEDIFLKRFVHQVQVLVKNVKKKNLGKKHGKTSDV